MSDAAPTTSFLQGAAVLTAQGLRSDIGVLLRGARIEALAAEPPPGAEVVDLAGGLLLPGFIDVQVNGGGGVLFNDRPTAEGIAHIAATHRRFGTTGLLPTLITDEMEVARRAVQAVQEAIAAGVPGVLGIHLEGPFLNPARKGVHDAAKMRTLDDAAVDWLCAPRRGRTLLTLAPECAPQGALRRLVRAGVIVSAGHTDASYEQMRAALAEGLSGFTHLFNAMSPLVGRAPGAVGAALEDRESWCALIVDGHHVHPAALRVALAAKSAERCLLVTDAMPTVGTDDTAFMLGARRIVLADGRLTDAQGVLAGSALDMASAVRNAVSLLRLPREAAVRMASCNPARLLRLDDETGAIAPGLRADLVHTDDRLHVRRTWIAGA